MWGNFLVYWGLLDFLSLIVLLVAIYNAKIVDD